MNAKALLGLIIPPMISSIIIRSPTTSYLTMRVNNNIIASVSIANT